MCCSSKSCRSCRWSHERTKGTHIVKKLFQAVAVLVPTSLIESGLIHFTFPKIPLAAASVVQQQRFSQGCNVIRDAALPSGNRTLIVQDPQLGEIERLYELHLPSHQAQLSPAPLVLGFHGQSNSVWDWTPRRSLIDLAKRDGWILVLPEALQEEGTNGWDRTWNDGTAGDNSTCLEGTTGTNCMDSCSRLGRCGKCNWATCYSDLTFISTLLRSLEEGLCLDPARYFVVGESNGGLLTHHLLHELPGTFLAAAPVFASPLLGYMTGNRFQLLRDALIASRTSILQLYDRSDTVIPSQGGSSSDGWLYESMLKSIGVWASIHGCDSDPVSSRFPESGGPTNVRCEEFPKCSSAGQVAICTYDGQHGDWPDMPRGAELVWNFFAKASNSLSSWVVT
mmetsp:Transcript_31008/g.66703  ORF Transcript_31008/g.66703 Transcript_31008/m.66703 type:complete len:395 (-) Transcript_31008:245-1429(-)|eukprot:CAMPEP_0206457798 /NCGR_PEP_ID=MMETSP0324_2-20121206/23181_1 /ASSEMBLY_ACC=CAM_ASM_000836 /TAXON_ID=2866 /ORGANISM="Crypthecodinium cohnii, Strain Seligo" /LENGTH=394 /DNA_ID=CAMNT_0053928999 /DNA_START=257 /DNA_END=1441 /DNA_ORIENTATION=-